MQDYELIRTDTGVSVKSWTVGVPFDPAAKTQLLQVAQLPFIHKWVAAMPDVHVGIGATVGSVIATDKAIIPAAVGVDIGCGMMAAKTSLSASDLPDNLHAIRDAIERAVPHGRTDHGRSNDRGAWKHPPDATSTRWNALKSRYDLIVAKHPKIFRGADLTQLGTLGTGNHFIELCLDENKALWIMLHSGSRGPGNRIGTYFIDLAKKDMRQHLANLPDRDLAYLSEGAEHFEDYVQAVHWAQDYARTNRELMMQQVVEALKQLRIFPPFDTAIEAVNCHHNYVSKEYHYGKQVFVTRKGAVRAGKGDMGIIPGSMGARSFIVRGLGNPESFESCSHGAGRVMSRTAAKKHFKLSDHIAATVGVECRKDVDVIDETPGAYKDIDAVMRAQKSLVEIVYTLKQIVCVKG